MPLPALRRFALPTAALAALTFFGCTPKVGAKCTSTIDCSSQGDRLCDTSQPDGYCTIFNCEPDRCPGEAACVAFHERTDPACFDPQQWARFARSFCMKTCNSDDDCRAGYVCAEGTNETTGSEIIDAAPTGSRICVVQGFAPTSMNDLPGPAECGVTTRGDGAGGDGGGSGTGGQDVGGARGSGGFTGAGGAAGGVSGGSSGTGGQSGGAGTSGHGAGVGGQGVAPSGAGVGGQGGAPSGAGAGGQGGASSGAGVGGQGGASGSDGAGPSGASGAGG